MGLVQPNAAPFNVARPSLGHVSDTHTVEAPPGMTVSSAKTTTSLATTLKGP
jgi:hypothetical protein